MASRVLSLLSCVVKFDYSASTLDADTALNNYY